MIGGAADDGRLPACPVVGDPGRGSTTRRALSVAAGGLSYPSGMKKISHTVLTYERISTIYRLKAIIPSTHASLYPIQFNF
jgi:hypothetical protein